VYRDNKAVRLDSSENPPAASHSGEAPGKQFIRLFGPKDTKLKLSLFLKDLLIKKLLACFDLEFALVVHVSIWLWRGKGSVSSNF
jgi:hypothetical protein